MSTLQRASKIKPSAQRGAVAIEFVLLFGIFFVVLYGSISYGIVMMVQQALTQAASEGARATAGKINPLQFTTPALVNAEKTRLATEAATNALSWLPQRARSVITVGVVSTAKQTIIATGAGAQSVNMSYNTVTVTYPDYANSALLPTLKFPGFGSIPSVPTNLVGKATVTP